MKKALVVWGGVGLGGFDGTMCDSLTTFSGEHCAWAKGVVMPVVWKKKYGEGRARLTPSKEKARGLTRAPLQGICLADLVHRC